MTKRRLRIIEFLIIGLGMGIVEDLLAIFFATDSEINWRVIYIVVAVAIPFAFISEIVVDHPRFWESIFKSLKNESGKNGKT